jgi:hypothetical protein
MTNFLRPAALAALAAGIVACAPAARSTSPAATDVSATTPPPPASRTATAGWHGRFSGALQIAERYRAPGLDERRFTHDDLWSVLGRYTDPAGSGARVAPIGRSMHGREIRSVTFGTGPTTVLLWSQMHGDEATATMSIADILRYFAEADGDPLRERLRNELTVVFVPMLNPDGAELFQRENAAGVDVNRDARRLATPEARALKELRDRIEPEFGFNLHDQNARTRVGRSGLQAGIALLAPAYNEAREYNAVRGRARLVAAAVAQGLASEIPGRIAKYDDGFTPRAFGDLMQQWGTSTVLIESGALPDDPQKQRLRALNAAAILLALDAIATGDLQLADPDWYESLPQNAGGAYDRLVTGGTLVLPGRAPVRADLAINYADAVARTGGSVREVGDLADAVAIDTVDAAGLFVHPRPQSLLADTAGSSGPWLQIGAPAELEIRRGADASSELIRVLEE